MIEQNENQRAAIKEEIRKVVRGKSKFQESTSFQYF